jgi:hypothetical protein
MKIEKFFGIKQSIKRACSPAQVLQRLMEKGRKII